MRFIFSITVLLVAYLVNIPATHAQQLENSYGDWNVYTIKQHGKKVCYIASGPVKKTGNYSKRSDPYLLVTHVGKAVDEVSANSGYPYKKGVEVTASIDSKKYQMFTKGEHSWAYDTPQDREMVGKMKAGAKMTIRGTSQKGTYSLDTYSLKGFTKAYSRMKRLCN